MQVATDELYDKANRAWFSISNVLYQHKKLAVHKALQLFDSLIRGRFKIKNTKICGKSPKGGGGVRAKIKKVYISNVDSLNFSDFSQI